MGIKTVVESIVGIVEELKAKAGNDEQVFNPAAVVLCASESQEGGGEEEIDPQDSLTE